MILGITPLGCWKDDINRAISGGSERLGDRDQENAIKECYLKAIGLGYDVFAVQDGNECFTSADAEDTYQTYGREYQCSDIGTGGRMMQNVYKIGKVFIEQA